VNVERFAWLSMIEFLAKYIEKRKEVLWKFRKLSSNVSHTYIAILL
jgi:hypothetical protein